MLPPKCFLGSGYKEMLIMNSKSGEDGRFEIFKEGFRVFFVVVFFLDAVPGFKPEFHLFQTDEVVLPHRKLAANGIDLVLLQVAGLPQANPHLAEGDHTLALDLVHRLRLSLLLYQLQELLHLTLAHPREVLLLKILQILDEFDLLGQEENRQAHDLLVDRLLDGNAAVLFKADCGDVLEGFNARGVDVVKETPKIHLLFVAIQSEQHFEVLFRVGQVVFLEQSQEGPPGQDSVCTCDVVEEGERVEVGASGEGLAVGLQSVFLVFEEGEVTANTVENLMLLVFRFFCTAVSLHNDYYQSLSQMIYIMSTTTKSILINNHKTLAILNADDFGYNSHIDRGILELLASRRIRSLSVIVNGSNILQAADEIRQLRDSNLQVYLNCSIGLHFNLTEGTPLNPLLSHSPLAPLGSFLGKPFFYQAIRQADRYLLQQVAEEARLQILRFSALFGRRPSHIDGHNHVHLVPEVAHYLAPLLRQMGIYRVRSLVQQLGTVTISMNRAFLSNYQAAHEYYRTCNIISPRNFIGLQSFGHLAVEPLTEALGKQEGCYRSVELMCHPGYPDDKGTPWVASPDRLKQLQQLSSVPFSQFRQHNGIHSYLDLKDNNREKKLRVLIYSKLERGCGNQTTTLRLERMLEQMGFAVYLWNVVDCLHTLTEAEDLFLFLLNFRISLIVGVNATRSAEIIEMATEKMRVPFLLIIAGTDANITFRDKTAVGKMEGAFQHCQCLVSLSEDMTAITRNILGHLGIQKEVLTIVQSSCIKRVLEEEAEWSRPIKPYILFPTSFRKVKCVQHVLLQLNAIIQDYDFDVYIAGPVLDQPYFQQCQKSLGKINYLGVLPKTIYARYLQNAFAIINTSQSEGMSCSILEAFELQVPVIARNNPGNLQLVQHLHNGLVYSSPEEFIPLFLALRNQPELRLRLTANSYQLFQKRYNYEHELTLYTQLIQKYFTSRLQVFPINHHILSLFDRAGVHPASLPNLRLFSQIPTLTNGPILDIGCGSGIFGLAVLSQSPISEVVMVITDISLEIVAHAVYNYQQSTVWDSVAAIRGVESDMFQNLEKDLECQVVLFNPPQSPFRHSDSRPDKNGGPQAIKFIQPMFQYFSSSSCKCLYQLYSFLAWPARFRELLQEYNLRVTWESGQEIHTIRRQEYEEMEEGLSSYILDHLQEGRALIQYEEGSFRVPAVLYRIERQ